MLPRRAVAIASMLIVGAQGAVQGRASSVDQQQATSVEWTIPERGLAGKFYRPTRLRGAAVLLLAGSEGEYAADTLARSLADAGHPVLALAYFSGFGPELPGIPKRLERVPLEYFDQALDALAAATHLPLAVMG